MNEENARKYLFDLDDCMKEVGIPYMLYGGTCLGAYRQGTFIPCDQDIDTLSLSEDWEPKWRELAKSLTRKGFTYEIIDHRHKREWDGKCYAIKAFKYGEHGDINSFAKKGKYRYQPSHASDFYLTHLAENVETTQEIDFYGRKFRIPRLVEAFLTEKYGDWKKPHKEFYNVSKSTCKRDGDDFWSL